MKQTKRMTTMVVALCALIVLFVGYKMAAYFNQKAADKQAAEDAAASETIMIADYDYSDVTYLSYCERGNDPIEIVIDSTGSKWLYKEDNTLPLNQTTIAYMANAIASMGAASIVNTTQVSEEYGFDDPAWTFSVSYDTEDDIIHTYYLGNYNSFSGTYYFKEDGVDTIYMIVDGLTEYFNYSLHDLADTGTFPVISEDKFDSVDITIGDETVHLSGDDITEEFVTLGNLIQPSSFVSYHITNDSKAQYGLDNPTATVSFNYTETITYTDSDGATSNSTVEQIRSFVLTLGSNFLDGDTEYTAFLADGYTFIYSMPASVSNSILSYFSANAGN